MKILMVMPKCPPAGKNPTVDLDIEYEVKDVQDLLARERDFAAAISNAFKPQDPLATQCTPDTIDEEDKGKKARDIHELQLALTLALTTTAAYFPEPTSAPSRAKSGSTKASISPAGETPVQTGSISVTPLRAGGPRTNSATISRSAVPPVDPSLQSKLVERIDPPLIQKPLPEEIPPTNPSLIRQVFNLFISLIPGRLKSEKTKK